MIYAKILLEIVHNTPKGVLVYCPNVNELCRDIHEHTGVMLKPKRQTDEYTTYNNDYINIKQRINNRKHLLKS